MPLDRHAKRFLDMVAAGQTAARALSPKAMRQAFDALARSVDARDIAISAVEDRTIPSPAGLIPLRIYTPLAAPGGPLPALVYFHGGAGVFCSIDTHDGLCRLLANGSGCKVISVGYRLAPENKFPAAVDDACAATAWVLRRGEELGVDPARVGVAGDSAGAALAAVVCQQARRMSGPAIAVQILICPVTDPGLDSASRRAFSRGYFFDMEILPWALGHYLPPGADLCDPRLAPLRAAQLGNLPPAQVHTAQFDPFLGDGEAYASALARARVKVAYTCHAGLIHHFYCMAGVIPCARHAIESIAAGAGTALARAAV